MNTIIKALDQGLHDVENVVYDETTFNFHVLMRANGFRATVQSQETRSIQTTLAKVITKGRTN